MRVDILTLFPGIFEGPLRESILGRAIQRDLLNIVVHNIRDFAPNRHRITDDAPYGGGGGMVMKPEPIFRAVESLTAQRRSEAWVVLLSPQGHLLSHKLARELATRSWLILICGRYEGVDERVSQYLVDDQISIGDYILTGGELPALVLIDAVARLIPGVVGDPAAPVQDSYAEGLLEYPHYTRPADFRGYPVPEVLLSGDHASIARWRRREALRRTWQRRPDLLAQAQLSLEDLEYLRKLEAEQGDQRLA